MTGRDEEKLQEALARLGSEEASAHRMDLAESDEIRGLFGGIKLEQGRLDVVVIAAGTTDHAFVSRANVEHWRDVLQVNLVGPALVCQAAMALMRKARTGQIVLVGSTAGRTPRLGYPAYSAAKAGIDALAGAVRLEAKRIGVKVSVIQPDRVATDVHPEDTDRSCMVQVTDVAETVAFLLRLSAAVVVPEVVLLESCED